MSDMDAYKDVFLAESADYLQQVTDGLLALESVPKDLSPVETIFRGAHSLKGMAAAMGYGKTADLTHKMESLMDRVRKGELPVSSEVISLMLTAVDLVRDLIDDESSGKGNINPDEMMAALEELAASPIAGEEPCDPAGAPIVDSADTSEDVGDLLVKITLDDECVLKAVRAYMVIKRLTHMGEIVETRPSAQDIEDERFNRTFEVVLTTQETEASVLEAAKGVSEVADVLVERAHGTAARVDDSNDDKTAETRPAPPTRRRELPKLSDTQTVRISIGHLDTLVDLVGELVILRSRLERIASDTHNVELIETVGDLQSISTDLQYEVMQTRMVPVGNIFNRFPRMARDLAMDLGKQIDFRMDGLDIELDRTVLDEIGDPLVHLLRNSIDHGIENAEERTATGKPPAGTITLSASRERDHVAIIVSDDGKGMDVERVWQKAVERGLVEESQRCDYDESDILQFTCVPGFSTAETATKVSGRGVGMDVVKGKIEYLGGTVQIKSRLGQGTDFILRLPPTLAIIQALLVEAEGQVFALPLSSVEEVLSAEEVTVDTIDGVPVVVLRDGALVPMHRLDALLFERDPYTVPEPHSSVLVVQSGTELRALQVDALVGRTEVVVKPLSALFRDQKGFSGATILGDGRVMLIIDPRVLSSVEGRE